MSSTTAKNLLLSQPKIGQSDTVPVTILPHSTIEGETSRFIKIEVPGINPTTINVDCVDNKLFVECERGELVLPLDATTDFSEISADIQWGMLTIKVPHPPSPVSRKIRVTAHDAVPQKAAPKTKFTKDEEG